MQYQKNGYHAAAQIGRPESASAVNFTATAMALLLLGLGLSGADQAQAKAPGKSHAGRTIGNKQALARDSYVYEKLARVDSMIKDNKLVDARLTLLELTRYDPNNYSAEVHGILAETSYRLGNSKEAIAEYKNAIKYGGKDWRLYWNAALSCMNANEYQNAILFAEEALKQEAPAEIRPQAQRFIQEMQEKLTQKSRTAPDNDKGDYLNRLAQTKEANLWALDKMPLKVYLAGNTDLSGRPLPLYKDLFRTILVESLNTWARASNGKLSFVLVEDPKLSDLAISFTQTPADVVPRPGEPPVEQGLTRFFLDNRLDQGTGFRLIQRAQVQLLLIRPSSQKPLALDEIKEISLHELGHALGLRGHSENSSDIMYFNQSYRQLPALTKRDKATMARLYASYPALSNSGVSGFSLAPYEMPPNGR